MLFLDVCFQLVACRTLVVDKRRIPCNTFRRQSTGDM